MQVIHLPMTQLWHLPPLLLWDPIPSHQGRGGRWQSCVIRGWITQMFLTFCLHVCSHAPCGIPLKGIPPSPSVLCVWCNSWIFSKKRKVCGMTSASKGTNLQIFSEKGKCYNLYRLIFSFLTWWLIPLTLWLIVLLSLTLNLLMTHLSHTYSTCNSYFSCLLHKPLCYLCWNGIKWDLFRLETKHSD